MSKKSYSEKLKSPKWQKKRLEILQRDKFTCTWCGDKETELHVNHLKYTGEPHEAPNEDLQTLCKHCHVFFHEINDTKIKPYKLHKFINEDKRYISYAVQFHGYESTTFISFENGLVDAFISFKPNSQVLRKLFTMNKLKYNGRK